MASGRKNPSEMNLPFYAAFACTIASFLLDFMAFSSPYWLEAYPETNSKFLRMGLWSACFDRFIHPRDTHANVWTGCYWIFNWNFWNKGIWEWLNPRWLIAVQVVAVLAFVCHCIAALCMVLYFVVVGAKVAEAGTSLVCQILSVIFLFIGIVIFGVKHEDRYWMARPDFNHLSWSFAFAVLACFISILASVFTYMVFSYDMKHQYDDLDDREREPMPGIVPPGGEMYAGAASQGPVSPQPYGYGGEHPASSYGYGDYGAQVQYANLQHGAQGYDPQSAYGQEPGAYSGYYAEQGAYPQSGYYQDPTSGGYYQDPASGGYYQDPTRGGYPQGSYRQEPAASGSYRQDQSGAYGGYYDQQKPGGASYA